MEIRDLMQVEQKPEDLSNKDLYHLCQEYGRGIKALRRIFSVLLVEVFRRNLHRRYGFESIHEFGAKIGGMNELLVNQILSLSIALKDKPLLWKTFRTVGWSKLRVIVSVATKETDEFWAEKVGLLSKPALEVYVKWYKETYGKEGHLAKNLPDNQLSVFDNFPKNDDENPVSGLMEPKTLLVQSLGEKFTDYCASERIAENKENKDPGVWKTKLVKIRFNISEESEFRFRLFKQQFSKKRRMAMTSGEAFEEMLGIVEKAIKDDKEWRRFLHL